MDDERLLREAEAGVNVDGGLVWVALDVDLQHRRALLITRDIIAERPYHKEYVPITWRGCSLRRWLNTVFYLSLPTEIKSRIVEAANENPDTWERETASRKRTQDRVFLLSVNEVARYFKDDNSRVVRLDGHMRWWWLRSTGYYDDYAANVNSPGFIDAAGSTVQTPSGGVRPALWLSLDE